MPCISAILAPATRLLSTLAHGVAATFRSPRRYDVPRRATFAVAPNARFSRHPVRVLTPGEIANQRASHTGLRYRNAAEGQPLGLRELAANENYTSPHRRRLTGTIRVDKMDELPGDTSRQDVAGARARSPRCHHRVGRAPGLAISNARLRTELPLPNAPQDRTVPRDDHRPEMRLLCRTTIHLTPAEFADERTTKDFPTARTTTAMRSLI